MTIWEKAVLNIQRGAQRVSIAAVLFSERARAEIAIVRLRIRIDEVRNRIDELYQAIGRRVVKLGRDAALPKTSDLLMQDEEISASVHDLADREKELADLVAEIRAEQASYKPAARPGETPR